LFLVPLFTGFGIGVLIFSKIVDYLLSNFEMYTRFSFLGLIIGTVPLFYKEVKKEGFSKKYYIFIGAAVAVGVVFSFFSDGLFPKITDPNLFQSVILGVAVAASSIIPGVDSAVILSTLGLYEIYVSSIANLDMPVLIPAAFGLVIGALVISFVVNKIIKRFYTASFSIIFSLFLTIIPSVLTESCKLALNTQSVIAIVVAVVGFCVSFFLGDVKNNVEKIKKLVNKKN
jgi:putative membrane protein